MVSILVEFREKQKERVKKNEEQKGKFRKNDNSMRANDPTNDIMSIFALTMDNYVTLPKAINALQERGVKVVSTARFRQSWSPEKLRIVNQTDINVNDLHYCCDKFWTLVDR